ncbi:MAG: trypsin-like peptidase domain-containing protein [Planctomycetota bacterium]
MQSNCSAQTDGPEGPTLYFFTNDHCGPCKQLEPVLLQLAQQGYPITRIDTMVHRSWVEQFRVMSTPTVVFVDGNRELLRYSGFVDGSTVAGWFTSVGFRPGSPQTQVRNRDRNASDQRRPTTNDARGTFALAANPADTSLAPSAPPRQIAPAEAQSVSPYLISGGPMPASEEEFIEEYTRRRQADNQPAVDSTVIEGTTRPDSRTEADAMMATVRLRVEDPEGVSYATGTVIHCHDGEWLILTCGHVFRDSAGQGTILIDYDLSSPNPRTASGDLISYDSDDRDVALVATRTGIEVKPIPIAAAESAVRRGDEIFSLGCDHGERPTIRRSRIKATARYNNVTKYDIYGRPVDGRSGGGLFTPDGRLIGVCNAAAVDFDEGIYTALDTIYWQLETAGLDHLFQTRPVDGYSPKAGPAGDQPYSLVAATGSRSSEAPLPNDAPMTRVSGSLPPDNIASSTRDSFQRSTIASGSLTDAQFVRQNTPAPRSSDNEMEVFVIVRSRVEPDNAQTIRLPNPSPQLLNYLEDVGNQQVEDRSVDMARMRLPIQRVRYR